MNFLIKRKLHRIARGFEFRFWRIDRRDHHAPASIDDVLNETQRMAFLFLGLSKKMLRQLRQRLGRKMRPNRVILQLRAELVSNLFVNGINDFLTRKHGNPFVYSCLSAPTRDDQSEHEASSSESEEKIQGQKACGHSKLTRQIQASRSHEGADEVAKGRSTTRIEVGSKWLSGVRCRNLASELSPKLSHHSAYRSPR